MRMTMSIRAKIALMTAMAMGVLAVLSSVTWLALERNSQAVIQIQTVEYPGLQAASLTEMRMQQAAERFDVAVSTGDAELLQANQQLLEQIQGNIRQQQQLVGEAESEQLQLLLTRIESYFSNANQLAASLIAGTADFALIGTKAQQNASLLEGIQAQLAGQYQQQTSRFEQTVSELEQQNASSAQGVLIACIATAGVILVLGIGLAQTTRHNLAVVTAKLQAIASGDGDLTAHIDYQRNDEIAPLVAHINQFIGTLHGNIKAIVDNTHSLEQVSQSLQQGNQATLVASQQQLDGIDEVALAVSQMSSAAQEIAGNANDTAQAMEAAASLSQQGNQFVHQTIEAMHLLVTDVQQVSAVVDTLNRSTRDAESILDAINAIAEQTNLLALNAAIEAARAGEQGRGFAVVADEVRTLASRTQSSTKEIQQVLAQLQQQADAAMTIINGSVSSAEQCTAQSAQAEQALQQVQRNVADVADRNARIATATEEQGQSTQQIDHHLQQLSAMARNTADNIDAVDKAVGTIGQIGGQLAAVTSQFKING
ncbi:methyl-accepting chemotaxis protein [Ferrimonas senticii]|uniref:methyl-accepting chemotaxis protein n=1 Tax=Ferrimonas senticii TaxID=394566 RepID=UPI000402FDA6|nr:methyl-accepting chemotaxis protein [Ferrimonas senticii]